MLLAVSFCRYHQIFFSTCIVKAYVVQPYSSSNTGISWKYFLFILSDFDMDVIWFMIFLDKYLQFFVQMFMKPANLTHYVLVSQWTAVCSNVVIKPTNKSEDFRITKGEFISRWNNLKLTTFFETCKEYRKYKEKNYGFFFLSSGEDQRYFILLRTVHKTYLLLLKQHLKKNIHRFCLAGENSRLQKWNV